MATKAHTKITPISLIPWDPESPSQNHRLYQQRLACGWKEDMIERWRGLQRSGAIALQWVIISTDDVDSGPKLEQHRVAYPDASSPLTDTCSSFGGKSRTPTNASFVPVGHISLDTTYESPGLFPDFPGQYFVATFWISEALQGMGLGRAAMDAVEGMACDEPLNARVLALSTVAKVYEGREEKWRAMGREAPKLSNQDWYERRGYEVFGRKDNMWEEKDPTGKPWPVTAVLMRKNIS